jgi:hypothetical protein
MKESDGGRFYNPQHSPLDRERLFADSSKNILMVYPQIDLSALASAY